MHRSASVIVGALLLVVVLAGCDVGDPEPEFSDEVSLSPNTSSASASPSPSETFDPTEETAKEFIRRWIRLSNEAQRTGETDEYRQMTEGCQECRSFADHMERIYRDGGFVRTKGERVRSISHEGGSQWRVEVKSFPTVYRESRNDERGTFEGGQVSYLLTLKEEADEWRLTYYAEIQ